MAQIVAVAQQESFRLRVVELFVALETAGVVFAVCLQEETWINVSSLNVKKLTQVNPPDVANCAVIKVTLTFTRYIFFDVSFSQLFSNSQSRYCNLLCKVFYSILFPKIKLLWQPPISWNHRETCQNGGLWSFKTICGKTVLHKFKLFLQGRSQPWVVAEIILCVWYKYSFT